MPDSPEAARAQVVQTARSTIEAAQSALTFAVEPAVHLVLLPTHEGEIEFEEDEQ